MYAPRRFRRLLLLPPGWLALAFFLLLGCLILVPHWRQLRLPNVLQVTMPRLKPTPADWRLYNSGMPYKSAANLSKLRPWHTVDFMGQPLHDFVAAASVEAAIASINADSSHAGGVRVRLLAGASYASMVKVLDIMEYTNQRKYWLALHQRPATLYAITDKKLPLTLQEPILYCDCCGPTCNPAPVEPAWLAELKSLGRPAWQPLVLMLALLGMISLLRLSQPAKTNHL